MAEELVVRPQVSLAPDDLQWRFSRASGPGGQGVNTTDSRVQLSYDLGLLPEPYRTRARNNLADRAVDDVITVVAAERRSQFHARAHAIRRPHPLRHARWRGAAPNVVQATAKVRYAVRARELPGMRALVERVKKVAAGAAMMTETQVDAKVVSAVSNLLGNTPLEQAMQRQMEHLGPPPFDAADRRYAAEIQGTLTQEDIASAFARAGVPVKRDAPLCDFVVPYGTKGRPIMGSTDVGDVSWVVRPAKRST